MSVEQPFEEAVGQILDDAADPLARAAFQFQALTAREDAFNAAAIDGGQSVIADVGAGGIVAVRAGYALRRAEGGFDDRVTRQSVHYVQRGQALQQWKHLVQPYDWGTDLDPPALTGHQWIRAWCEAERTIAEFDAARRALRQLRMGDMLLLDGSLDTEVPYPQLVASLLENARREGVTLLGVTKDTGLSIHGMLPFTLEVEHAAQEARAPPRFAVDVTALLGRPEGFRTYAARFDPTSPVYRVDVSNGEGEPFEALRRLLGLCNDVAYPGYPYPLARIHQNIHYADDETADMRHRLESIVAERRGSLFSMRLFGRGRDVLALGG